ncbi:MAG TPA: cytochrome c-type biogenesis protein [Coxiellaceae bacterium]|nr:cytochrome c-type biogenesis protein [Coxiellaceae bacterium]
MKKRVFIFLPLFFISVSYSEAKYVFNTPQQQQQFQTMTQELRCLVCQNESIADSQAPLAQDLKQQVYQMIVAGKTEAEIKLYMQARYGDFILFKPPVQKNTWILWALPFLLLGIAAIILIKIIFSSQRPIDRVSSRKF